MSCGVSTMDGSSNSDEDFEPMSQVISQAVARQSQRRGKRKSLSSTQADEDDDQPQHQQRQPPRKAAKRTPPGRVSTTRKASQAATSTRKSSRRGATPKVAEETLYEDDTGTEIEVVVKKGAKPSTSHTKRVKVEPQIAKGEVDAEGIVSDADVEEGDGDAEQGDGNDDHCSICLSGGELLCCDSCPKAFHNSCAGVTLEELKSNAKWFCHICRPPPPPVKPNPWKKKTAAATATPSAQPMVRHTKCEVCSQDGSFLFCMECPRVFHAYCVDSDYSDKDYLCAWCTVKAEDMRKQQRQDINEGAGFSQAELNRVRAGRSLSNSAPRRTSSGPQPETSTNSRRIKGPTSALTSFLAERGIEDLRTRRARERREAAARGEILPTIDEAQPLENQVGDEDDDAQPDNRSDKSAKGKGKSGAPRSRATRRRAVDAAMERVQSILANETPMTGKGKGKDPVKKGKGKGKGKANAKKGKNGKGRKKGKDSDNDYSDGNDDDEDEENPFNRYAPKRPKLAFCGTCGTRVEPGNLVCLQCRAKAPRRKGAKGKRKKAKEGTLLDQIRGNVMPLQQLCVKFLCDNIDKVDEFGAISEEVLDNICRIVSFNRKLTSDTVPLFLQGHRESLILHDCAGVDRFGLELIPQRCELLQELNLQHCGRLYDELLLELSKACPLLHSVTLGGCFLITDNGLSKFIESCSERLLLLSVSYSDKISKLTLEALSSCPNISSILFQDCIVIEDQHLVPLSKTNTLTSIGFPGSELLTDHSIVPLLKSLGQLLKSVNFSRNQQITDQTLVALASSGADLEQLRLRELSRITDKGLSKLLSSCKSLKHIDLTRCTQLTDEFISFLPNGCLNLSLNSVDSVTKTGLVKVAETCKNLQQLDISWCPGTCDDVLDAVHAHCTNLKEVAVFGCTRVTDKVRSGLRLQGCADVL